jgi:uncharacterized protein (DUF427 family)
MEAIGSRGRVRGEPATKRVRIVLGGAVVAWSYDAPYRESAPIAGLVAFFDEHVDVFVEGEFQSRPKTAFS